MKYLSYLVIFSPYNICPIKRNNMKDYIFEWNSSGWWRRPPHISYAGWRYVSTPRAWSSTVRYINQSPLSAVICSKKTVFILDFYLSRSSSVLSSGPLPQWRADMNPERLYCLRLIVSSFTVGCINRLCCDLRSALAKNMYVLFSYRTIRQASELRERRILS